MDGERKSPISRRSLTSGLFMLLVVSASLLFLSAGRSSVRVFGAVGVSTSLVAMLTTSRSFQRWLDRDRFSQEIEHGKACLAEADFLGAALAFQRAAVYQDSWRAHYGLAYALEALGHLEEAVSEYGQARFIGYRCSKQVLAVTTSQYVRALARLGTADGKELALRAADDALVHLKNESSSEVDEIRLGRAFVLMSLRRDDEARWQFEELARSTRDEEMRCTAESGSTATGLIELAKLGPEVFFEISKGGDKVQ